LRDGEIDLEIGVLGAFAPEVRTHLLFRDQFLGVVQAGHKLLSAPVTPERYAAARHVVVSRKGSFMGPVDDALERLGLRREIVAVVPGFPDAIRIACQSDLVALLPRSCLGDASLAQAGPVLSFRLQHRKSSSR
jgi:DNA-binding transcriptional LysR family regulator